MFCGQCGKKNADNASFCAGCGAKLKTVPATTRNVKTVPAKTEIPKIEKSKNKGSWKVVVVLLLLVIVGVFTVKSLFGRSYKKAIAQYMEGSVQGDAELLLELVPEEAIRYCMDVVGYTDYGQMVDYIVDSFSGIAGVVDEWDISYEITDTVDAEGIELKVIEENYKKIDVKIKDAKKVELDITANNEDIERNTELDVYLVKIGSSWYLDLVCWGSYAD